MALLKSMEPKRKLPECYLNKPNVEMRDFYFAISFDRVSKPRHAQPAYFICPMCTTHRIALSSMTGMMSSVFLECAVEPHGTAI